MKKVDDLLNSKIGRTSIYLALVIFLFFIVMYLLKWKTN